MDISTAHSGEKILDLSMAEHLRRRFKGKPSDVQPFDFAVDDAAARGDIFFAGLFF